MRNRVATESDLCTIDPAAHCAGPGTRLLQGPVDCHLDTAGPARRQSAWRWVRHRLRPEEAVFLTFALALLILGIATGRGHASLVGVLTSPEAAGFGGAGLGLVLAAAAYRTRAAATRAAPWGMARGVAVDSMSTLRYLTLLAAWGSFYAVLHDVTPTLHPQVVDAWLVAADQALFRTDVSRWLNDHLGSAPMTHVMTFCYLSYFVAPLLYSAWHFFRDNRTAYQDLALSVVILGVLGYSGYALVPAIGPHLYQASLYPDPLPGSGFLIDLVASVQGDARDAFPSLHTGLTIVLLSMMWRDLRPAFWVYLPIGLGLMLSTMYLRRHYAVDLLAGVVIAVVALLLAPRVNRRWYARPPQAKLPQTKPTQEDG